MTPQAKMTDVLSRSGLPAKEIQVYGSQIVITAFGQPAAKKWAALISRFAKVRGIVESYDYVKEPTEGSCLLPQTVTVWRVFGALQ